MRTRIKYWFFCPCCDRRISAPSKVFGKIAQCPACRTKIQLPASHPAHADATQTTEATQLTFIRRRQINSLQRKPPVLVGRSRSNQPTASAPHTHTKLRFGSSSQSTGRVTASRLRVKGEIELLAVAIFLATLLSISTLGLMLVLLVIAVIRIKMTERRERQTSTPINATTFPELHQLSVEAAKRLEMHLPPIYLMEVEAINAHALVFMSEGSVVLYRGLVNRMTPAELQFIIGHELAHIKCGHTSWLALTHSTSSAMAGRSLYLIFHLLFRAWSRRCEFTCDRGGLLACANPQVAARTLARLEVPDPVQAESFVEQVSTSRAAASSLEDLAATHPRTGKRIRAVLEFSRTQTYCELITTSFAQSSVQTETP